jgi:hypothetical protein
MMQEKNQSKDFLKEQQQKGRQKMKKMKTKTKS